MTLRDQQLAFAAHLRDPDRHAPPPGIEDRRMAIYRELVASNIDSLLSGNFPVIRATLGDDRWQALVRDFHVGFRSQESLFTRVAAEFVRFVETRAEGAHDPAWLAELAHYEWMELALQIADTTLPAFVDVRDVGTPAGQALLDGVPVTSPCAWPLAYAWPVHEISPAFQPDATPASPTLLLLRRDAQGAVRFSQISPLVYRLLEVLATPDGHSGRAALTALADEAGARDRAAFMQQGQAMLEHLQAEGVLLGTRP